MAWVARDEVFHALRGKNSSLVYLGFSEYACFNRCVEKTYILHPSSDGGSTKCDSVAIAVHDLVSLNMKDSSSHVVCFVLYWDLGHSVTANKIGE